MAADVTDSIPLPVEDVDRIMARLVADAVAGVDPASADYPDVIPGAVVHDVFGALSLEIDRSYDRDREIVAAALPTTSTGAWLDAWADALGLERKDETVATGTVELVFGATAGVVDLAAGVKVSTVAATDADTEIVFQTTAGGHLDAGGGVLDLPIAAVDAGAAGNVAANTVTLAQTEIDGLDSVRNPDPTSGGTDVETDEALQGRIATKLRGAGGAGNVTDYENWALAHPGVGHVTVQPNWAGPGSVRVLVTDPANDPVGATVVDSLQGVLDPPAAPGDGFGVAPIGATVTVATPATTLIDVTAALTFETGYSLDGAGGTRPLRPALEAALMAYVNSLPVGASVVRNKIVAALVDVIGIVDADVTVPAADVAIGAEAVASLNYPPTLTAA